MNLNLLIEVVDHGALLTKEECDKLLTDIVQAMDAICEEYNHDIYIKVKKD